MFYSQSCKCLKSNHFHLCKHNLDGNIIIKIDCSTHFKLHQSCKYFTLLFKQKNGVINTLKMVNGYLLYTCCVLIIKITVYIRYYVLVDNTFFYITLSPCD